MYLEAKLNQNDEKIDNHFINHKSFLPDTYYHIKIKEDSNEEFVEKSNKHAEM